MGRVANMRKYLGAALKEPEVAARWTPWMSTHLSTCCPTMRSFYSTSLYSDHLILL